MTMRLAYTDNKGRVCIVVAAPPEAFAPIIGKPVYQDGELVRYELDHETYRKHVLLRSIPKGVNDLIELEEDWTPPDPKLRSSWVIRNGKVEIK